ncbi:MAG: NUDIX hydrolase [Clostridia bacterium]|nr:NUDIX hydrolase [Clostridia bacterium]
MSDEVVRWAMELQALAQVGLHYGKDAFDRERYARIREIAAEMMSARTNLPIETVQTLFCSDSGYCTPKIDTRAAIFTEDQILLVQENNGSWALPGGWCDFNLSPAENIVKEVREEAGLEVRADALIAVQDRAKHNQPPYAYNIVKLFFLCSALGGGFQSNIETLDARAFPQDALPRLAEEKTTRAQIDMCFRAYRDPNWKVQFD